MHEELGDDHAKAMLALAAAPEALAMVALSGRVAASELLAFASNPMVYCRLHPELCLSIVEDVGYAPVSVAGLISLTGRKQG